MLELDYEVAELTWENGQLAMHGLGPPRVPAKAAANNPSPTKNTCSGTLESIVNQATSLPQAQRNGKPPLLDEFATAPCCFHQQRPSMTTMDALVPCSNRRSEERTTQVMDPAPRVGGTRSIRVGSCSGPVPLPIPDSTKDDDVLNGKRARVARVPVAPEWSSRDQSFSGSATFGRESQRVSVTHDTYDMDMDMGVGFTGTSMGSPENTSSAKQGNKATTADDHDSVCHSRPLREAGDEEYKKKGNGKSTISTKRSRAAAIHNQSERKRRDKINQRMKTLQKLVPNSSKVRSLTGCYSLSYPRTF